MDGRIGGMRLAGAAQRALNPTDRKHSLCASMYCAHASSPFSTTHSSRGLRVSGQAQQIFGAGFASTEA